VLVTARGMLRIYLGAAPGVGKTVAMLDEGHRRSARGADVAVAAVDAHGRPGTEAALGSLPVQCDLDQLLARRPDLVLLDDLARHLSSVEPLLAAGIDVVTTLNVQELESLRDVVTEITGTEQTLSVPDAVVRSAAQIELVDMSPEALRRRMAHGNIYPPEKIDAALGSFFRPGTLSALRQLALLWLADQVDDGLRRYRGQHGITDAWETRERVLVALTGGPEGDALIRRAARIAARTGGGDLLGVHVARSDGPTDADATEMVTQRALLESLGGTYHSLIGDDVATALVEFARSSAVTQLVVGASRHRSFGPEGVGAKASRLAEAVDVHVVSHTSLSAGPSLPSLRRGLSRRRRLAGLLVAVLLLAGGTWVLTSTRSHLPFASDVCVYLLVVVITSLVGGFYPALLSAVVGSLLLNYYFAPPIHTLTIAHRDNLLDVVIFLLVTVLVSRVVELAARRSALASRAGAEAEMMSTFAGSMVRGEHALPAMLDRVQETFGMRGVSLLERVDDAPGQNWLILARRGDDPPSRPSDSDCTAAIDDTRTLALRGRVLHAEDQRVLSAFAVQVAAAYRQGELAEAVRATEPLAEAERARTALLNAVSHDLRTPIAAAKASVSSLRAGDIAWPEADRRELLATADNALDRLTDLVTNLLDLSRLQAGVLPVLSAPFWLDDVVANALNHAAPADSDIEVAVPTDLPEVYADAGLLERVLANLVQNAVRYAAGSGPIRISASAHAGRVELRVVDRGPGIDPGDAQAVFTAFQREDDSPTAGAGVGLGLAIARGFVEAMNGTVTIESTPGGGATFVVSLPAVQS
jgi:two-component system sensor histidine kinase KdpD